MEKLEQELKLMELRPTPEQQAKNNARMMYVKAKGVDSMDFIHYMNQTRECIKYCAALEKYNRFNEAQHEFNPITAYEKVLGKKGIMPNEDILYIRDLYAPIAMFCLYKNKK